MDISLKRAVRLHNHQDWTYTISMSEAGGYEGFYLVTYEDTYGCSESYLYADLTEINLWQGEGWPYRKLTSDERDLIDYLLKSKITKNG